MTRADRPTLRDVPLPRRDDPIWLLGYDVVRAACELLRRDREPPERSVVYG